MIGNVFFDMMTIPTYDEDRGQTYPAWTVCLDESLQISSDKVIQDKIQRTITDNAEQVVIPIAGTSEINSNVHLSLRKNLIDHKIEFLKDESEMEYIFANDEDWLLKSSEERAFALEPYLETRIMVHESISLKKKISNGSVGVEENSNATKDRYMCVGYLNYLCDKIHIKQEKDNTIEDSEWEGLTLVY